MTPAENGNGGSESWDPALWSIGTVIGRLPRLSNLTNGSESDVPG